MPMVDTQWPPALVVDAMPEKKSFEESRTDNEILGPNMFLPFTAELELHIWLHPTVKELGYSIPSYAWKAESQNCIVNSINDI